MFAETAATSYKNFLLVYCNLTGLLQYCPSGHCPRGQWPFPARSGLTQIREGPATHSQTLGNAGAPPGREQIVSNRERSMFVNVNAHPGSRPKALGQLGELSRERVILNEFKY